MLPLASSGITAILLLNDRTSHSCFKIPIELHQESMCNISRCTMIFAFEALDKTL